MKSRQWILVGMILGASAVAARADREDRGLERDYVEALRDGDREEAASIERALERRYRDRGGDRDDLDDRLSDLRSREGLSLTGERNAEQRQRVRERSRASDRGYQKREEGWARSDANKARAGRDDDDDDDGDAGNENRKAKKARKVKKARKSRGRGN